jgi:hypothetical protein
VIANVRDGLGDLVDDDFWTMQARSLAVSASADWVRTFRLPNWLSSVVEVANRSYLAPLLLAVTFPQAAFVLALAAGSVRLVEVTPEGPPYTVEVPGMRTEPSCSCSSSCSPSMSSEHPAPARRGPGWFRSMMRAVFTARREVRASFR